MKVSKCFLFFMILCVSFSHYWAKYPNLGQTIQNIQNGQVADPSTAKFVTWVSTWYSGCTGVLVSDRIVLTAAHCFIYKNKSTPGTLTVYDAYVVINHFDWSYKRGLEERPAKAYIDKEWLLETTQNPHCDIAVVVLTKPIEICENNDTPIPMPMPFKVWNSGKYLHEKLYSAKVIHNSMCRNYGYGAWEGGGGSNVIRYSDSILKFYPWYTDLITDPCDGSRTASGDSGGPMFCYLPTDKKFHLLGIHSGGVAKADIRKYQSFIFRIIEEQNLYDSYIDSVQKCKKFVDEFLFEPTCCPDNKSLK